MSDADRGPVVSDQEILAVFAAMDDQQLLTREVADELPISVDNLSDRLDDLRERDLLVLDDEGDIHDDRWQLAPGARTEITISGEEVETTIEAQATKTTGVEAPPRSEETPETPPPDPQTDSVEPLHESPTDAIEAFDPPGTPDEKDRRREALRHVYVYIRDRGTTNREELESAIFPEASSAYDRPDDWWEEVIQPGMEALPGIAGPDEGGTWHFTHDPDEMTED